MTDGLQSWTGFRQSRLPRMGDGTERRVPAARMAFVGSRVAVKSHHRLRLRSGRVVQPLRLDWRNDV